MRHACWYNVEKLNTFYSSRERIRKQCNAGRGFTCNVRWFELRKPWPKGNSYVWPWQGCSWQMARASGRSWPWMWLKMFTERVINVRMVELHDYWPVALGGGRADINWLRGSFIEFLLHRMSLLVKWNLRIYLPDALARCLPRVYE